MAGREKKVQGQFGKILGVALVAAALGFVWSAQAQADMTIRKLYKEAFPGSKPKCIFCHINKLPKKADGAHDSNEYGLKVAKGDADEEITIESLQALGEAPVE